VYKNLYLLSNYRSSVGDVQIALLSNLRISPAINGLPKRLKKLDYAGKGYCQTRPLTHIMLGSNNYIWDILGLKRLGKGRKEHSKMSNLWDSSTKSEIIL
jgi:hypothetical protein